jgi:histone acetyltransferase MYST1
MSTDNTPNPTLEIGDTCQVVWRDGSQQLLAKIIETRVKKKRKQDNELELELEYYVHYIHHDRRLDEWVGRQQFVLETLVKAPTVEEQEGDGSRTTRGQRRRTVDTTASARASPTAVSLDPTLAALEQEHEETTKVKNISKIYMGGWEVEAWYFSPYPDEYSQVDTLYVCEYCLKYMRYAHTFTTHRSLCDCGRRPPGREIYRHGDISVMEVDGKEARVYCQNLCLLAKLFLDHKTLYYDVDPFMFYVICHVDEYGLHIVGYFSKEKVSDYNLACILVFPQYQKGGYGKFIISLSYELTKREGKTGSPEKPLSDLGKMAYRSYWTHILMNVLASPNAKDLSIKKMAQRTGIKVEDIISTLQSLDMIKCWKGQHVVHVKQQELQNYIKQDKQFRLCKNEYLKWEPNEKA